VSFGVSGQRLEAEIGLYFYNARFYDATLGRFAQADTIIPGAGNVLTLDRYAYTLNNPLRYNDPSGHYYEESPGGIYVPPPKPPMPGRSNEPEPGIPWNSIAYELSPEAAQQLINDIDLMLDFINILDWLSMGTELAAGAQSLLVMAGVRGLPVFSAEFVALAMGVTVAEAGTIIAAIGFTAVIHTIPVSITKGNLDTLRNDLSDLDLDVHGGYVVDEIFVIYHNVNVYSQKGHRTSVVPEVYPVVSYLPTFLLIWSTVWRPEYFD